MKSFLILLFLLISFNHSYTQNFPPDTTLSSKFFMNMSLSSNFSNSEKIGLGMHLSLGYKITDNLAIILSSGYMNSYTDPESYFQQRTFDPASRSYYTTTNYYSQRKTEIIPAELSIRYNFDFNGIKPYVMYSLTQDYLLNEGDFDALIQTVNEATGEIVNSMSGKASDLYNWKENGFGELGGKISFGILIPVKDKLGLDFSYTFNSVRGIHSFTMGLNFDIK